MGRPSGGFSRLEGSGTVQLMDVYMQRRVRMCECVDVLTVFMMTIQVALIGSSMMD